MKRLLVIAISGVILSMTLSSEAQVITWDGCVDSLGRPVVSVLDPSINDVAQSSLGPGGVPEIRYNRGVLAWFAPETRLFWYGHECGHHARGHVLGSTHPLLAEQDADCYSIQVLMQAGLLDRNGLIVVQNDLSRTKSGDWTHLPGPQRAINLARCIQTSSDADVTVEVDPIIPGRYGAIVRVWMDDVELDTMNNMTGPYSVKPSNISLGTHRYRVQAKMYSFDALGNLMYPPTTLLGSGTLLVNDGDTFKVIGSHTDARIIKE